MTNSDSGDDTPEPLGHSPSDEDSAPSDSVPNDLESLAAETFDQLDQANAELEVVTAERDDYLDRLRRLQAEFENYKKRVARDAVVSADRATGTLAEALLPVLDSCDAGLAHGAKEVEPIFTALLGTLEKGGLERVDPLGLAFDPEFHEAVMHEPSDDADEGPVVVEVMRPGYVWKGQVLRPAMVKVRG